MRAVHPATAPASTLPGTPPGAGSWLDAEAGVLAAREQDEVRRVKQRLAGTERKRITHDRLVAGLSLGFWTGLFTRAYEIAPDTGYLPRPGAHAALWPKHLRAVFPHLRRRFLTRGHVYPILSELARVRNQVFHHRPVWRLPLNAIHVSATEAIGWISPELQAALLAVDRFPSVHAHTQDAYVKIIERLAGDTG
jgi:hypothetical protein